MEYDVIVFDTAPTGHTLRFLNFPTVIEKGLTKLLSLKQKFGTLISGLSGIIGNKEEIEANFDKIVQKMESLRNISNAINNQMKNPVTLSYNEGSHHFCGSLHPIVPIYVRD